VVVLDISMPVMNGLQATKFLRDLRCRSRIVILTTYEDKEYIDAAFSCGANAFVTDLVPVFGTKLSMISAKERGSGYVEDQAHRGADYRSVETTGGGT
jgi:DNA-binding NarL/FixJ family response regulator